jgi:hypothetical protein
VSAITLDPELRAKLNGLNEHLEVHDESGRVVGHFLPDELYTRLVYSWARQEFANAEEHKAAMATPGGYSTAEAIAFVEQITRDARSRQS